MSCPFCERIEVGDLIAESEHAVAFADGFPVSSGHTLIVPRRHEPSYFHLTAEEQAALWLLVHETHAKLAPDLLPNGYNVGINIGEAAGQTIAHAHIHLIPRFDGDVDDPRGGVRHVIPYKGSYW